MCTIGAYFYNDYTLSFKQCDLVNTTEFYQPKILVGLDGIRYMKFGREGNNGSWCGVNNFGVSFSAADSYLNSEIESKVKCSIPTTTIFDAYLKIISEHKDAYNAARFMYDFYKTFTYADIVLISDYKETYYIEAFDGEVICVKRSFSHKTNDNHFISTNHFRYIHGAVDYSNNHSTYLRLERAKILSQQKNKSVFNLLSDQYYGKSVNSICRSNEIVPKGEEPYFTQATAVFAANGQSVNCAYLINGNPQSVPFVFIQDVFDEHIVKDEISDKFLTLTTFNNKNM
jgi:hypothetical protein